MNSAGLPGLCLSQPPSRPCSWPPLRPAPRTGEVSEVTSPRPAELRGASSQPKKGFIGFVQLASCGQEPPGTRQPHRKAGEEIKRHFIPGAEADTRESRTWLSLVSSLPSSPVSGLCLGDSHTGQGRSSQGDTGLLDSHLEALGPGIKDLERASGEGRMPGRCLKGHLVYPPVLGQDLNLMTSSAEESRPPPRRADQVTTRSGRQ